MFAENRNALVTKCEYTYADKIGQMSSFKCCCMLYSTPRFQIVSCSTFSRYIYFSMYIDIIFIYLKSQDELQFGIEEVDSKCFFFYLFTI